MENISIETRTNDAANILWDARSHLLDHAAEGEGFRGFDVADSEGIRLIYTVLDKHFPVA